MTKLDTDNTGSIEQDELVDSLLVYVKAKVRDRAGARVRDRAGARLRGRAGARVRDRAGASWLTRC